MTSWTTRWVPDWVTPNLLRTVRWIAIAVWALVFADEMWQNGIPYYRSDLLLWLAIGLTAASIGKRNLFTVVLDFGPLALVLIAYDYLRGISDSLGMPTWWHPQIDADRFLFLGTEPTVWLQEHLKQAQSRWWDALAALCYVSFFFLPYVTAAVLWMRSRADFYRWSLRFVALSFLGFTFFALTPAAPPWAAAKCTAAQVADHPYNPACLYGDPQLTPHGGILGAMTSHQPGANPWVERIVGRGFADLHLHFASIVIKVGQAGSDQVAAVPSLHAGGIMLFTIFMWRRLNRWWRPVLVAYPVLMAWTLMYTAEHYFADVLTGWLAAALVCWVAVRVEKWRRTRPDTLEAPSEPTMQKVES
jgi:hypothetical protein